MIANDKAPYVVSRFCNEMHEIAKKAGAKFSRGYYKIDSINPKSFITGYGYTVSLEDFGTRMRITFEGKNAQNLAEKVTSLSVSRKYKGVLSSAKISGEKDILRVDANFVRMDNTSGRTQSNDKLYYSIKNSIIKPVLREAMGIR